MLNISNFLVVCNSATNFLAFMRSDLRLRPPTPGESKRLRTRGSKTRRSLIKDYYSHQELEMLSNTYFNLWRTPDVESCLNLGQRQLVRLLEIKPGLAQTVGVHNVSCEDWPKCTSLMRIGDQIGSFFGTLIMINRRRSLIMESRSLGRHLYELGKSIIFL